MSHKIRLDVRTLSGSSLRYEIDSGMRITEFVRMVIATHPAFADPSRFNRSQVVIDLCQILYNGRKLDLRKTFEEYTEFQVKSDSEFKIHIIPKGGEMEGGLSQASTPVLRPQPSPIISPLYSSPIQIKPLSLGPGSFLESQINRLDRMDRTDRTDRTDRECKSRSDNVSEGISLSDLADKIDRLQSRVDQIFEMLRKTM
jgi:hypothetical protein